MPPVLKICYFPGRETNYARNRVLLKAMKKAGLVVYDCSCPRKNFFRYIIGFFKFLYFKSKCDVVFVGFLGQFLVPLVRLLTQKPVMFDAFVSVYQTLAFDRRSIHPHGLRANLARFIDRFSCRLADKVILDTQQHVDYFVGQFHVAKNKFSRIWVGSDDDVMYPRTNGTMSDFIVHFHGEFQGLHGAEYIIEVARLLPYIKFQLIGRGQKLSRCLDLAEKYQLKNVTFIDPVPYERLPDYMARASVCLGLFGETSKAQLVIPHKVYEALAMGKPVVTADTPAIRELLTHRENVYLCQAADPISIVEAIEELFQDGFLREKIADGGYEIFKKCCSPAVLGAQISKEAQMLLAESAQPGLALCGEINE